jgi:hypothetical protein
MGQSVARAAEHSVRAQATKKTLPHDEPASRFIFNRNSFPADHAPPGILGPPVLWRRDPAPDRGPPSEHLPAAVPASYPAPALRRAAS